VAWRRLAIPEKKHLLPIRADRRTNINEHKLMSVEVRQKSTFQAGVPRELFRMAIPDFGPSFPSNYEVVGQGERFLVNTLVPNALSSPISVVLNWTTELKH
jgi:hypothetical protein